MFDTEMLIIGGGPAGLKAALSAAEQGADVLLVDRNPYLGGQLVKQTHMFFGSQKQYASERGVTIAEILTREVLNSDKICVLTDTTALGYFEDKSVALEIKGTFKTVYPKRVIVATGAQENTLIFPNSDLPGIYGAGAVQTLMNVHGVMPGARVAMVGAGNIGVIVSYQLLQAGVEVVAIIEAAPRIGGYHVHAAKVRRLGVPIYIAHTVVEAHGRESLEGITIACLDEKWQPVKGTEIELEIDVLCISVGLSPLTELLFQAGCKMEYVPQLGGHVPYRSENLETTVAGIYVAGDVCAVEEASAAMVAGQIAGLAAAGSLGYKQNNYEAKLKDAKNELAGLRRGPAGEKVRSGLWALTIAAGEAV
ncbi:MAG: FAD-dependent oxidoreductase [Clostridiales bacterium]|jgi:sarcosine oxidase subunit alpha|nr:FAD-dependent oxidoreductase [Clostridiales bacterium]